ncbi:acyl-CoA desaturase, partial [Streptomyces sp. JV178]
MTTSSDVIEDAPKANDSPGSAPGSPTVSATLGGEQKRSIDKLTLVRWLTVRFLGVLGAVALAWGWGVSWLD